MMLSTEIFAKRNFCYLPAYMGKIIFFCPVLMTTCMVDMVTLTYHIDENLFHAVANIIAICNAMGLMKIFLVRSYRTSSKNSA